MIYQTAVITQQGGRLYNEDSLGHLGLDDGFGCWVVADGLGGHGGGDVASQLAVETILAGFKDINHNQNIKIFNDYSDMTYENFGMYIPLKAFLGRFSFKVLGVFYMVSLCLCFLKRAS